jgi:hypothetical protein
MKFDTDTERLESTERIMADVQRETGEIKLTLINTLAGQKGLNIEYLNIFFNVTLEEFQIFGMFTYYGTAFWVMKSNTMLSDKNMLSEFYEEIYDWVRSYSAPKRCDTNKNNKEAYGGYTTVGFANPPQGFNLNVGPDIYAYNNGVEAAAPEPVNNVRRGPAPRRMPQFIPDQNHDGGERAVEHAERRIDEIRHRMEAWEEPAGRAIANEIDREVLVQYLNAGQQAPAA